LIEDEKKKSAVVCIGSRLNCEFGL
jgi:hypothetical protein